jgi:hypothetical protein
MRFYIGDPKSGKRLATISPLSLRARCWLARVNQKQLIPDDRIVQVCGGVLILEALDYHHDQFETRVRKLAAYYSRPIFDLPNEEPASFYDLPTPLERKSLAALDHEAVAYLNRLGQFWYFAKAMRLRNRLTRVAELVAYRNKHTAHRSIDMPRKESIVELEAQAMAFGFHRMYVNAYPIYQLLDGGKHIRFTMREDHAIIMDECLNSLYSIYAPPVDA